MENKLPVTLLSGFLGAGKTTLLQHILKNNQGLKCALIVNDMAELNIDSELLSGQQLVQTDQKLISMQNGCICCTLREDLLLEVTQLAKSKKFDYLIIESTGISEPLQVAETFTFENQETQEILGEIARLDTCVTVVDCVNFFNYIESSDQIIEKFAKEQPTNGERPISELMINQIEFAQVIVINKCDQVSKKELNKVKSTCQLLNPQAQLIETSYSKVDLNQIINTGKFSLEEAKKNSKFLLEDRFDVKPESEEFGVFNFIYRRQRPFHPLRIYKIIDIFMHKIITPAVLDDLDENEDEEDDEDHDHEQDEWDDEDEEEEEEENEDKELIKKFKEVIKISHAAKQNSVFKDLLRSKGFMWLCSKDQDILTWQQQGVTLQVNAEMKWKCAQKNNHQYQLEIGDRQTQLVFIGLHLDEQAIQNELDKCLVTEEEWDQIQKNKFLLKVKDDPFDQDEQEEEHDNHSHAHHDHHGHSHHGHSHHDHHGHSHHDH